MPTHHVLTVHMDTTDITSVLRMRDKLVVAFDPVEEVTVEFQGEAVSKCGNYQLHPLEAEEVSKMGSKYFALAEDRLMWKITGAAHWSIYITVMPLVHPTLSSSCPWRTSNERTLP